MKRFVYALIPALAIFALTILPVGAGVQWCRSDPIISFNGTEVNMWVAIPEQYEHAVNGPIDFTVQLPSGVDTEVLYTDPGFNGHGETVSFFNVGTWNGGRYRIVVTVFVPFDYSLIGDIDVPVLLTLEMPDGTSYDFEGTSSAGVRGVLAMTGS